MTFDPAAKGRTEGDPDGPAPVTSMGVSTMSAAAEPTQSLARPARLLVIDDDENVTNMLRRALSFEGYTVATARDGEEGPIPDRKAEADAHERRSGGRVALRPRERVSARDLSRC